MNELQTGHALNRKDLEHIQGTTERIETKLDNFIETAHRRFAPRWVADVLKWVGIALGMAIIGALMSLILIQ